MKKAVLAFAACLSFAIGHAQVRFVSAGKIEFEKRVNLHNNMDNDSWSEMLKKNTPKTKITYFDLFFKEGRTLYRPGREVVDPQRVSEWILGPATDNIVSTDLQAGSMTSKKTVFDASYLIADSLRKIDWRITNDTRTIAGFECRKAVGVIMDSVYVIAFFTDQILVPGGPESFNNLPGMILGVAVPRLHTTWYATKLELVEPKPADLAAPEKGKKINKEQLAAQLKEAMEDWGKEGKRNMWQVML